MKYGLIAERVGHSFSPEIHKKLFGYDYELMAISPDELDSFMREKNFTAINVTIPHKQSVIPYLDTIDETASLIGAVNTIVNKNGHLFGYNTDILGITAMLKHEGIELNNKKVLILGSGGTSKTAFFAAKMLGASEIKRVSRTGVDGCITYQTAIKDYSDADIIINTTPSGMFPNIGVSAIELGNFKNLSGVVDAIYNPLSPKLVVEAKKRGIKCCGGLYMLVAQAAFAAEKFVGKNVNAERIDEIYYEIFKSKQNIVLVGMPGCGKSTVGKILAEKLGREFLDTDDIIKEKYGRTPSDIIIKDGEQTFRDIESEIIEEVSAMQSKIISTGGGAVLRKNNTDLLSENGKIYFLDRLLSEICPTEDRPLSADVESLKKRYEERYDIYCACADVHIKGSRTAEQNADIILEDFR